MQHAKSWPNLANDIVMYEDDIKHSGFLRKQSLVWKIWRNRWCVLTSQYLFSFKYEGDHRKPTEVLALTDCVSVRPADNETGQENSFCVVTKDRTFCLIANSADEKEQWTAAIMNSVLPELSSRGLRRSLTLFSIGELDQEDDDEECTCVTTPKTLLTSLMTPRSRSESPTKSKVRFFPKSGDRADASTPFGRRLSIKVPSLDAGYPCDSAEADGDTPVGFNLPSSKSSDASPRTITTPRDSFFDDCLLGDADDRIIISPRALPSRRPRTPPGTMAAGSFGFLDAGDKRAKKAVAMDFYEGLLRCHGLILEVE